MIQKNRTISNRVLLLLFFISGIAGLLYQLGWMRLAMEIFGSTVAALGSVTAIYFGGIALGSFVYGRKDHKTSYMYGKVQLFLAGSVLLSLGLFAVGDYVSASLFGVLFETPLLTLLYRLSLLTIIIGPASFYTGATFPLMVGLLRSDSDNLGKWSARAYGVNAFGAVLGALLSGMFLLPSVGIWQTIVVGVLLNTFLAVYLLGQEEIAIKEKPQNVSKTHIPSYLVLVVIAIGFIGMGGEMLWARFIPLVLHSTVYTAMITVATVITGLALGALVIGRYVDRLKSPIGALYITLVASATSLLITFFIPASFWQELVESRVVLISLLVFLMLIPSFLSGMSFPLTLRIVAETPEEVASVAGKLNALNTLGGIAGSLLIGLGAIPMVGFLYSLYGVLAVQILVAFVILSQQKKIFPLIVGILLPILIFFITFTTPRNYLKPFLAPHKHLLYLNEGVGADVTVVEENGLRTLEIDRLWQGENRKTRQIMAAHIPMLITAGQVKKVLTIGVGPGVTASRFLMYPKLDSLHLVDLEPAVFEAAENYFGATWLKTDPRVKKIVADGRQYVRYTNTKYGIISIEIGQMFRPTSAQFYTKDFYEHVASKLTNDGLVSQFVPVASFDKETFKSVIRTFMSVFPDAQLWYNRDEFLLLGSLTKVPRLNPLVMIPFTNPGQPVGEDLDWSYWGGNAFKLSRPEVLAGGFLMGNDDLQRFVGEGEIYSDNKPVLEYFAAKNQQNAPFILDLDTFLTDPVENFPPCRDDSIMHAFIKGVQYENLTSIIGEGLLRAYFDTPNIKLLQEAYHQNPNNLLLNRIIAESFYRRGNYKEAIRFLTNVVNLQPDDFQAHFQIALAYLKINNIQKAVNRLKYITDEQPDFAQAFSVLGAVLANVGELTKAQHFLQRALELNPHDQSAQENLIRVDSQLEASHEN